MKADGYRRLVKDRWLSTALNVRARWDRRKVAGTDVCGLVTDT
jgi:hypothetical protein